jgi:hypothetical protein
MSMAIAGPEAMSAIRVRSNAPTARSTATPSPGTVDGDKIDGSVKAGMFGTFPMTGTRV